jgi:hypothetical protein
MTTELLQLELGVREGGVLFPENPREVVEAEIRGAGVTHVLGVEELAQTIPGMELHCGPGGRPALAPLEASASNGPVSREVMGEAYSGVREGGAGSVY